MIANTAREMGGWAVGCGGGVHATPLTPLIQRGFFPSDQLPCRNKSHRFVSDHYDHRNKTHLIRSKTIIQNNYQAFSLSHHETPGGNERLYLKNMKR